MVFSADRIAFSAPAARNADKSAGCSRTTRRSLFFAEAAACLTWARTPSAVVADSPSTLQIASNAMATARSSMPPMPEASTSLNLPATERTRANSAAKACRDSSCPAARPSCSPLCRPSSRAASASDLIWARIERRACSTSSSARCAPGSAGAVVALAASLGSPGAPACNSRAWLVSLRFPDCTTGDRIMATIAFLSLVLVS